MNEYNNMNQREGIWEIFDLDGHTKCRGSFTNDKRNGYWEHFWINGELIWSGYYKDDVRQGYWEIRDSKSRLFEKEFYL